jgi:hypothetical protein
MKKTIVFQVLIFIVAWFILTPDTLEDNTHLFGLIGSYDIIHGNSIWVMIGAGVLSVLNIWVWWPKTAEGIKSVEAKAEEAKAEDVKVEDPVVPKMD